MRQIKMGVISITPTEFGEITNRTTENSLFFDDGLRTAEFKGLTSGSIYESAPIDIPEPGTYKLYIYRCTYSSAATATFLVKSIASLGTPQADISLGTFNFVTGSTENSCLDFPSFAMTARTVIKLKFETTTSGSIFTGDIVLFKNP
jgi:hypothetical protein